jgi:hypothetical protein
VDQNGLPPISREELKELTVMVGKDLARKAGSEIPFIPRWKLTGDAIDWLQEDLREEHEREQAALFFEKRNR